MINTKEAIKITRIFASDMQEIDVADPHFDFVLETVTRNISMQAEHLENASGVLVRQANEFNRDLNIKLIANG